MVSGALDPERLDVLVLTDCRRFPPAAGAQLLRFIEGGGDVAFLGGRAFGEPVYRVGERWVTKQRFEELLAGVPAGEVFFGFEDGKFPAWQRLAKREDKPTRAVSDRGKVGRCMRIDVRGLEQWTWDNQGAPFPRAFPDGHNLLCFWAKGDGATPQMAVELRERDGSRWIAVVKLTTAWRRYALPAARFRFWADNSPDGRGGDNERLRMAHAARLSVGLAWGLTRQGEGDHTLWIDEIAAAKAELPQGLDFSATFGFDLVFRDYEPYVLRDVVRVAAAPGQDVLPRETVLDGPVEGAWAVGFPLPGQGRVVPLLRGEDEHGRDRGWAAGIVANHAGKYEGSNWLLVGVTTPAFYRSPAFADIMARVLRAMASGDLAEAAASADQRAGARSIKLRTPPPDFLRLSDDGKHIVHRDGRRFFMLGCNYIGPFDRRVWSGTYTVEDLEQDFRRARRAGLNCLRVYGVKSLCRDPRRTEALKELARRHGIYLLLEMGGTGKAEWQKTTIEAIAAEHKALAAQFADEPMVLGYDLQNEPYVGTVGAILYAGRKSPIVRLQPHERFAGPLDRLRVARWVKQRPDWPKVGKWLSEDDARQLYAAVALWEGFILPWTRGDGSTFPGLKGRLRPEDLNEVVGAIDATFALWLDAQIAAIREVDKRHLITVGYNTPLTALPANRRLDFVSEHVYQRPYALADVMKNVTTLDRLATLWPGKPISLGEFGYSNGIAMGGGYLDLDSSAVGEMIHWLYALSRGYEGCKKWMLVDWPLPYNRRFAPWLTAERTRVYEERFGLFFYDGTPEGRPKPIAHGLRFLRDYVDRAGPGGELDVRAGPTPIGAVYVYRGDRALFLGARGHSAGGVSFKAAVPTNLMLDWGGDALRVLSTADATATVEPTAFLPGLTAGKVDGRHGGLKREGRRLTIELLAGETVRIR